MKDFFFDCQLRYVLGGIIPLALVAVWCLVMSLAQVFGMDIPLVISILIIMFLSIVIGMSIIKPGQEIMAIGSGSIITAGLATTLSWISGDNTLSLFLYAVFLGVATWQLVERKTLWGEHNNILPLTRGICIIMGLVFLGQIVLPLVNGQLTLQA